MSDAAIKSLEQASAVIGAGRRTRQSLVTQDKTDAELSWLMPREWRK